MIKTLTLVENIAAHSVNLHPDVLTILFEHRRYIKTIFLNIRGLYEVDHLALTLIDPEGTIIVFSSTPNIEYNLIHQNLWKQDTCFSLHDGQANTLCRWSFDAQEQDIKKIKLQNNKFNFGFTIPREVEQFKLLYSYATRSKNNDLHAYYEANIFGLMDLGDYFYKSTRDLYCEYCSQLS